MTPTSCSDPHPASESANGCAMLMPAFLYGPYREVRAKCQKVVRALRAGADLTTALPPGEIDTTTTPGLLVLHGPSPLLGAQTHFQCYLLHFLIRQEMFANRVTPATAETLFRSWLTASWGILGLLSQPNQGWLFPRERHGPFLRAVLTHWDEMDGAGARYSNGIDAGARLWPTQQTLSFVLVESGVPSPELSAALPELPAGGLPAFLQRFGLPRNDN
jgi:hypothetical protein